MIPCGTFEGAPIRAHLAPNALPCAFEVLSTHPDLADDVDLAAVLTDVARCA
jgi:hypothetical protein